VIHDLEPRPSPIPDALRSEYPQYFASPQTGSGFANTWEHPALLGFKGVLRWKTQKNQVRPTSYRAVPLSVPPSGMADFEAMRDAATRLFWIGHASFLVAMDGVRIVIDPIFGRPGGVVSRVTPAAARAEELGDVSCVLVTHGHHDHMDPGSLKAIAQANPGRVVFVVPRGLGGVLPKICRPVVELSWWESVCIGGVRMHLVPAQHWHRRGLFDENKGLWGGYVIEGTHRVFHSGDTGYFRGFEAIGRAFGGIDAACLPLGAYEPSWFMASQHMSPAGSLLAHRDLGATHFVGMHWGTFDLSDEPLDAGPRFLHEAVAAQGLRAEHFHVLSAGGSISLHGGRQDARAQAVHLWDPRT